MRRRDLVLLAAGATIAAQGAARAQQPGRVYRLAMIVPWSRSDPRYAVFLGGLARHRFVEGKNLRVDPRGFNTPIERFYEVAVEMARSGVDAIYCAGGAAFSSDVRRATRTIPIVTVSDDFLKEKVVASLAHPGGNITGVSIFASELDGKRQQLLLELVPGARRIAALVDPATTPAAELEALQKAAHSAGVGLTVVRAGRAEEIAGAIEAAREAGAEALNVLASLVLAVNQKAVIAGAAKARLPAIYQWPYEARAGGLAAYGPPHDSIINQSVRLIAAVLRGEPPADIPVERPDTFAFVINLRTAKVLGLTFPPSLLARADEVIQ